MTNQKKGFLVQLHRFFGKRPGQTLLDFVKEVKVLSDADRHELCQLLNTGGYPCDPPALWLSTVSARPEEPKNTHVTAEGADNFIRDCVDHIKEAINRLRGMKKLVHEIPIEEWLTLLNLVNAAIDRVLGHFCRCMVDRDKAMANELTDHLTGYVLEELKKQRERLTIPSIN